MAAQTTWADVLEQDRVADKGGGEWQVAKIANKPKIKKLEITLDNGAGKTPKVTVSPTDPVTIIEKAAPALAGVDPQELAAAVVQSTVGGQVILVSDPEKDYGIPKAPRTFLHPGARLAHLYTMHGVERPTLEDKHDPDHGEGTAPVTKPHTHED